MSYRSESSVETDSSLAPPELIGVLDDIPGGENNLLPKDGWLKPLRVAFELWSDFANDPSVKDVVQLILDGDESNPVDTKDFFGTGSPFDPALLFLEVPANKLSEGVHSLVYQLLPWNHSATRQCLPVPFTVDKTPPILAADSKLIFPPDVLPPNALTADYLADPVNQDRVLARVPAYSIAAPGDVVIATWKNPSDGASKDVSTDPLTHLNYTDPITLAFTGDFIRDMGDGKREVTYRVEDRAGNSSVESTPVELLVAAIRPPRFAPFPWVVEIEDTPSDWGELNPEKTLRGATVRIPAQAVYFKDDKVMVWLGQPGTPGAVGVPVGPDTRDVMIAKEDIAAVLGKTLPVTYVITMPDNSTKPSDPLTLVVRAFPPSNFLGAQLAAPHSDPAYKKNITAAGLPIFQRIWPYISIRCLITITVTGTGTDNQSKSVTIVDAKPVSEAQVVGGVSAPVAQAFMLGLKSDMRFIVLTQVSFDNGASWFPFTELRPMLKD